MSKTTVQSEMERQMILQLSSKSMEIKLQIVLVLINTRLLAKLSQTAVVAEAAIAPHPRSPQQLFTSLQGTLAIQSFRL